MKCPKCKQIRKGEEEFIKEFGECVACQDAYYEAEKEYWESRV